MGHLHKQLKVVRQQLDAERKARKPIIEQIEKDVGARFHAVLRDAMHDDLQKRVDHAKAIAELDKKEANVRARERLVRNIVELLAIGQRQRAGAHNPQPLVNIEEELIRAHVQHQVENHDRDAAKDVAAKLEVLNLRENDMKLREEVFSTIFLERERRVMEAQSDDKGVHEAFREQIVANLRKEIGDHYKAAYELDVANMRQEIKDQLRAIYELELVNLRKEIEAQLSAKYELKLTNMSKEIRDNLRKEIEAQLREELELEITTRIGNAEYDRGYENGKSTGLIEGQSEGNDYMRRAWFESGWIASWKYEDRMRRFHEGLLSKDDPEMAFLFDRYHPENPFNRGIQVGLHMGRRPVGSPESADQRPRNAPTPINVFDGDIPVPRASVNGDPVALGANPSVGAAGHGHPSRAYAAPGPAYPRRRAAQPPMPERLPGSPTPAGNVGANTMNVAVDNANIPNGSGIQDGNSVNLIDLEG